MELGGDTKAVLLAAAAMFLWALRLGVMKYRQILASPEAPRRVREKFARPRVEAAMGWFPSEEVPYRRRRARGVDPAGVEPAVLRVGLLRRGARSLFGDRVAEPVAAAGIGDGNRTRILRWRDGGINHYTTPT